MREESEQCTQRHDNQILHVKVKPLQRVYQEGDFVLEQRT